VCVCVCAHNPLRNTPVGMARPRVATGRTSVQRKRRRWQGTLPWSRRSHPRQRGMGWGGGGREGGGGKGGVGVGGRRAHMSEHRVVSGRRRSTTTPRPLQPAQAHSARRKHHRREVRAEWGGEGGGGKDASTTEGATESNGGSGRVRSANRGVGGSGCGGDGVIWVAPDQTAAHTSSDPSS
jgi:hypothetical protein